MQKLAKSLALTSLLAASTSALAAPITDGDWSDWFSYGGNSNNNNWQESQVTLNNGAMRTQSDEEGPTSGSIIQLYDIEQIFYFYDDADANALTGGRLHIGLVTGFPAEGIPADDIYAGDLFVDFGNTGGGIAGEDFDIAIATSTRAADAARFEHLWLNDGPSSWTTEEVIYPAANRSNPYRVNENAVPQPSDRTGLWNSSVAWGGMGAHNFLEISFDVADFFEDSLTNATTGGLGLHWTMQSGADAIDVQDNRSFGFNPPVTPPSPVPEPYTALLVAFGVMSLALRKKR